VAQRHGRSAPEPAGSLYDSVLVPPTDCCQGSTARQTLNDLQGRCDVVQSWRSGHDSIRPMLFGRSQPIRKREVRTEVEDCQSLPACRGGERQWPPRRRPRSIVGVPRRLPGARPQH
jgi:hypothetical protein